MGTHTLPGHLIEELVRDRGWSYRTLAVVLGMTESAINKVVRGNRRVTAALAIQLGELFEVNPREFLELQNRYDLHLEEARTRPDPGRATRAHLFGSLPVTEMIKRGWINATGLNDVDVVQRELARFFGVDSVEEIEFMPHAAKKTDVAGPVTPSQLAWLRRVKKVSGEMLAGRYSRSAIDEAIARLRPLTISADAVRDVPKILAQSGVRFVVVQTIKGAKIDGACFWLNAKSPVIGMSLRFDRIDNFWFVLRHELEHVRLGHGRDAIMLDTELVEARAGVGEDVPKEERLANAAAAEFGVPQVSMDKFIKVKAPYYRERDLIGFSRAMKVHPGIVAGQLQHRTGRFDRFRKHLVKVRKIICSAALTDGWGDVIPMDS